MEENIEQKASIYKISVLTSPILKYIALALFILLPFVGFYLGMQYEKKIANNLSQQFENTTIQSTITVTPTQVIKETQQTCEEMSPNVSGTVSSSTSHGMCTVDVASERYKFDYPMNWELATIGAAAINMSFSNSDSDNFMYLFITSTDNLTIENAHLATICYECVEPDPLIAKDEVIVTTEVKQFGSNKVEHVRTKKGNLELSKYFLINKGVHNESSTVYMFDLQTDSEQLINQVEELLKTFSILE